MIARAHLITVAALLASWSLASAQNIQPAVTRWQTVTAQAPGSDQNARDEAIARALRQAVEQACGVFLKARSTTENYQGVYDKVFADAVGYVQEHKVLKTWVADGMTYVTVQARVSTQKFEENWASIAHTVNQENNPRVIVAIAEAIHWAATAPAYETDRNGTVQGKIEDFFLQKGLMLMDREASADITKRDVLLAALKDDTNEVAALGARFKADVVVVGRATARFGKTLNVGGQQMHQFTATLNVRVVQTDSARVLVVKSFGPVTITTLQMGGGEEKALSKLAEDSASPLLSAVVQAWAKRANVSRTVQLSISGMDYGLWKTFKTQAEKLDGMQALRFRDITAGVANIDAEYRYTNENLADRLLTVGGMKLEITEITPNRIKLKVVEIIPSDGSTGATSTH
ncbi:MAG: hypothetical protein WC869_06170 [Phycisphaerae bacterium]